MRLHLGKGRFFSSCEQLNNIGEEIPSRSSIQIVVHPLLAALSQVYSEYVKYEEKIEGMTGLFLSMQSNACMLLGTQGNVSVEEVRDIKRTLSTLCKDNRKDTLRAFLEVARFYHHWLKGTTIK